jgi:diguanylate cyclase (GGDEF)-like protein
VASNLTSRRVFFVSAAVTAAFLLFGSFIYLSQQKLLKRITGTKLAAVEVYSGVREKEEIARLYDRTASMSGTIAKLAAGQLQNSQSFNLTKDGMASTLEPFMDYAEIAAIEVTDKDDRAYASIWKSQNGIEFRADYAMPPAFREKYRLVVRTASMLGADTEGFVTVYVDDEAILAQAAQVKRELHAGAAAEIEVLKNHFRGLILPESFVLIGGVAFVVFASRAIGRSYRLVDAQRRELAVFNLQLEDKVRERTRELEAAVDENRQVNRDLHQSQDELMATISALRRKDEDMRHLAFHDALTGLPNRSLLLEQIALSIAVAARRGERRGIVFVDLDRFKSINDSLGHDIGDGLLKEVARRLSTCLRKSDIVGRLGGDEFLILLNDASTPDSYAHVAQLVGENLSMPLELGGTSVQIDASFGIACFPEDGESADELIRHADMAMYEAKTAGRGRFCFYQQSMTVASTERVKLEAELRGAIAHSELELFYQPKISLSTNAVIGVEALLRWRHPVRGLLLPGAFVPIAEATDLITPLGDWVLEEACRQSADWKARGVGAIKIAVNVSARQLQRGDLVDRVAALTGQFGILPSDLELELTESVFMANPQEVSRIFTSLRELGVVVAMDDFGTGYSSLAALRRLPIDVLKIDRSFVLNADRDEGDAEIVKMIIALARALKLDVVAEGVETEGQAAFLKVCGCPAAQGFLYARPAPAREIEKLLRSRASLSPSLVAAPPARSSARPQPSPEPVPGGCELTA